jgi:hypothetical protein
MNALRSFVVACLATAFLLTPAAAQQLDGYGLQAGVNRATMSGSFFDLVKDAGGSVNARWGFTLGGFASLGIATNTQLRPELSYTQRGVRVPAENGLRQRDLDLGYIDLAALVRRSFPMESVSPWVGAGAVLSINASSSAQVDDTEIDVSDEIKGTDFGLALEAGAGNGTWEVGLRYLLGLSNISESSDSDEAAKNRSLSVTVSYNLKR